MKKRTKIFISPWKSGTTSMGEALKILGFKALSGWQPHLFSDNNYIKIREFNKIAESYSNIKLFSNKEGNKVKKELFFIKKKGKLFNVLDDWPLGHECIHPFIKKVLFPDSKFIFLMRNDEDYIRSIHNWMLTHTKVYPHAKTFWQNYEFTKNKKLEERDRWISNYTKLRDEFPESVLFMEITEGWEPLCSFLNLAIPSPKKEFPYLNKRS